jgi:hypothetical protein
VLFQYVLRSPSASLDQPLPSPLLKPRCGSGKAHECRIISAGFGRVRQVPFVPFRIASSAAWVPVPAFDVKLGVLAIGNRLPTSAQDFLENRIG